MSMTDELSGEFISHAGTTFIWAYPCYLTTTTGYLNILTCIKNSTERLFERTITPSLALLLVISFDVSWILPNNRASI